MFDYWQFLASIAGLIFTFGFIGQLRLTWKTRDVRGLSWSQWVTFLIASAMFSAYYAHLLQFMMFAVSLFGTLCCATLLLMMFFFREKR